MLLLSGITFTVWLHKKAAEFKWCCSFSTKGSLWQSETSTDVNQYHTGLLGRDNKEVLLLKSKSNYLFVLFQLCCLISSEFLTVHDNSQSVSEMIWKKTPQNKLLLETIKSLLPILGCGRKHLLSGVLTKRSYGEEKLWWTRGFFTAKCCFKNTGRFWIKHLTSVEFSTEF